MMKLKPTKKYIQTSIDGYLKENTNILKNVEFKTAGDYIIEVEDLESKLNIIHKYFPFNNVTGTYDSEIGMDLVFDNGISIAGSFEGEPFNVSLLMNDNQYTIDIHPYSNMGGFNNTTFDATIKDIFDEQNNISIVLSHEGYAVTSKTITKQEFDDYKFFIVNGTQLEGKTLGDTKYGKRDFKEI